MVRCARCGSEWMAADADHLAANTEHADHPTDFDHEPSVTVSPALSAHDPLAASPAVPSSKAGLLGAWVATILVLAGAMTATIVWRDSIVRSWPPSSRLLGVARGPEAKAARTIDHAQDEVQ